MPDGRMLLRLCDLAVAGQLFLLASAWLLPLISEFSLISDTIGELVLGREGGVQALAFLICGLGNVGLAFVLRRFTRELRGSAVMSTLLLLNAVGLIVAGLVPTDRIDSPADMLTLSSDGLVHVAAAFIGLVCAVLAMFVGSWMFGRDCDWRPLVLWSVLLSSGSLALLFAQTQGPLLGLLQRALVTLVSAWMIMVALRARGMADRRVPASPATPR
ncbi:MAG TPA: DUF998 domain-containing protein [Actinophytocola sp.]|nr:DUF998 domain-containing protein [Actinophytocola sp.]